MLRLSLLLVFLTAGPAGYALDVITWNVESGGAEPATIARELTELGYADAYLLQEVGARDIGRYAAAIRESYGQEFKFYLSSLGGGDRLGIMVNEAKFTIRSFSELMSFGEFRLNDFRHRSPLVASLERKSDGLCFLLVNVHLARGNAKLRTEQAAGLREWAKSQPLPIVLAGDCNFDLDFHSKRGNEAYDTFLVDEIWKLAAPKQWVDTNWSDRNGDGKDDYPDSCLDFGAYYAGSERVSGTSQVMVRDDDFPDSAATSDHRPVKISIKFSP